MKAKGNARKGARAEHDKAAAELAVRAWAAALVAKLEGLSAAVREVCDATFDAPGTGPEREAGALIAGALNREVLSDIALDLHRLTETAAALIAPDADAELPDLLAEVRRAQ